MKRTIALIACLSAVLAFASCGSTTKTVTPPSPHVLQAIQSHEMTIDIFRVYPSGSQSTTVNISGYPIVMKDGKISGTLPYRGEANVGMYGGPENVSIVFENSPMTVKEDFSKAEKGKYTLDIESKAGNDDVYLSITFVSDGQCSISCKASHRSPCSFDGRMR